MVTWRAGMPIVGLLVSLCVMNASSVAWAQSQLIENLESGRSQKIVFYGTSLTASGAWRTQLQSWLTTTYGAGKLSFVNSGLSGRASNTGLSDLQSKVISHQPDTVFIEFATNDAFTGYGTSDPDYHITLQKSKDNLSAMIDAIVAANSNTEVILQTMNPAWDAPNGNQSGSKRPDLAAYFQGYRDVAAQRGLLLIDHYPNWLNLQATNPTQFESYVSDGVHPNDAGYDAIVSPVIRQALLPEPTTGLISLAGGLVLPRRRRRNCCS